MSRDLISVVVVIGILIYLTGIGSAATYYVNVSGSDSYSGNSTHPFRSIGKAILDATNGDTVIISDGDYFEAEIASDAIYITEAIYIKSENLHRATIHVNNTDGDGTYSRMFYLNANNITIDGLVLNGTGADCSRTLGIDVRYSCNNLTLKNIKFDGGAMGTGIQLNNGASGTPYIISIDNNTFYKTNGVTLQSGNVENLTISNNLFDILDRSAVTYGIRQETESYAYTITNKTIIANNTFLATGQTNYHYGIYFIGSTAMRGTKIVYNNFGNETGIWQGYGMRFDNTTNLNISYNNFFMQNGAYQAATQSIWMNKLSNNVTIQGNVFGSSSNYLTLSYALNMRDSNNSIFLDNLFYINGSLGAMMSTEYAVAENPIMENNTCYNTNSSSYCFVMGSEQARTYDIINASVKNNRAYVENGGIVHAFLVGYTSNSTIEDNYAVGGGYGFVIKGNNYSSTQNNRAYNNSITNFYDKGGYSCLFRNNTGGEYINSNYNFECAWNDYDGRNAINSTWQDNVILGTSADTQFYAGTNCSAAVINTSYSDEVVSSSANLTRKWYLDSSAVPTGTNITLSNSSGVLYTALSPNFEKQTVTSHINMGGAETNYSNYTVTASLVGYATNTSLVILTDNINVSFSLVESVPPTVTINSPSSDQTFTISSVLFNVTLNENGVCQYSADSGTTNNSMDTSDNLTFTKTATFGQGSHLVSFYCNDSVGNKNDTTNVTFSINLPISNTDEITSGGSGAPTYYPPEEKLAAGYEIALATHFQTKFILGGNLHVLKINNLTNDSVNITISSDPLTFILQVGQIQKIDMNSDGVYDLSVFLKSINKSRANLVLTFIYEVYGQINVGNGQINNQDPMNSSPSKSEDFSQYFLKSKISFYPVIIVVGILAVLTLVFLFIFLRTFKRRQSPNQVIHLSPLSRKVLNIK